MQSSSSSSTVELDLLDLVDRLTVSVLLPPDLPDLVPPPPDLPDLLEEQ